MKNLYFLVLLLAFPFILLAQNIHGLWSGTMVNDTLRVTQNFELALSEYRGKITGYTYQTYIIRDTFYYSVKRVKAERTNGFLVVEDVERVADNFPDKAARKVHMTAKFPLINDTTIDFLKGHWNTNQTKVYYAVGGDVLLKRLENEKESDLVAHLQELNVNTNVAVYQKGQQKEEPVAKNSSKQKPPKNEKAQEQKNNDVVKNSPPINAQPNNRKVPSSEIKQTDVVKASQNNTQPNVTVVSATNGDQKPNYTGISTDNQKTATASNGNGGNQPTQTIKQEVATINKPVVQQNVPVNTTKNNTAGGTSTIQIKAPEQKQAVLQPATQPVISNASDDKKVANNVAITSAVSQRKDGIAMAKELPSIVSDRRNETIQELFFKNDSLVLSLYDNGIVDGDTVSVFVNGENIIAKQKLKEAATKKTIYISPGTDAVQLVLFADNLGSIPPNTGLLTVRDGDEVYQVRFSADLQKNASIVLRRKKDQ